MIICACEESQTSVNQCKLCTIKKNRNIFSKISPNHKYLILCEGTYFSPTDEGSNLIEVSIYVPGDVPWNDNSWKSEMVRLEL